MREPIAHPGALDRLGAAASRALRCLAVAGALALAVSQCGCPALPPVAGCRVGAWECRDGRPSMCSTSQRWEPAGSLACAAVGGVCVVADGGPAHCARAQDGGAL